MNRHHLAGALAAGSSLCFATVARANPEPLPFSYVPETLAQGELEIEQYVDLVPTRALSGSTGASVGYLASEFQTEFEYGLSERLELGLYLTMAPSGGDAFVQTPTLLEGDGSKQRLKYNFLRQAEAGIGLSGYAELVENQREIEIEAKIIVARRFGPLRAVANAWAEREFYFDGHGEWVLAPTAGLVYEVTPMIQPGIEGWMHMEFADAPPTPGGSSVDGPHVYVGPTFLLSFPKLWWSVGVYMRATDLGTPVSTGDTFGRMWVRTVIGVPL